eukprot:scaffold285935_cov42-Prasinocladus_malaysianus.AAC.1
MRSSSPESDQSRQECLDRASPSGAESSCSALVERDHSTAVAAAQRKVDKAHEMMQVAFQILKDANKAVSDALSMAKHTTNKIDACEAVKSASYVASLAQQKAWKARAFLENSARELAEAQGAAEAAAIAKGASSPLQIEAEDTADSRPIHLDSSCALPEQGLLASLDDCFPGDNDLDKF